MNCLKKTPVLNRHCLRTKIEELSPLLHNLSWGPNKDFLFRATWSYYASGCQERLSSIRRRIEQNARIVAPEGGQKSPFQKDWPPTLSRKMKSKLPPGVDLEDHIYQEFVSCFRSAQGPVKVKGAKKQKELKSGGFPSPEEWLSWKRQEEQVDQALKKSKDPYLKEELSKKLEHLNKLTSRHPLIVLPNQKEMPPPEAPKMKSKRGLKSKEPLKKPGFASKPGPYVNRIPKTPREIKEMGPISQPSRTALTSFEKHHPSLETMDSIRNSFRRKHQLLKRREIHRHGAEYDNISGHYGIETPRQSVRNSQLDKARLSQAYDSKAKASERHSETKASKKHLKAEISETESLKKSKSSMKNLTHKFSKISYVSKALEEKAAAEAKNQGRKSTIPDKKFSTLKDSLFLIPHFPKSPKKHNKENKNKNFDELLTYSIYKIPEINQRERSREASQSQARQETSSFHSDSSILWKSKLNEDLVITHKLKRKSNSGRRKVSSIRKPLSWHSSVLANKDNRRNVVLKDTNPEHVINPSVQLSEDQSSIFGISLNAPGFKAYDIPENNPRDQIQESRDSTITNPVRRKSSVTTRHRIGSIRKPRSRRSSETSTLGYIPFKASQEKDRIPHKEYVPELTFTEPAAESTLSVHRGSRQNLRQVSSHGWPPPVGLQRHQEYVNPFGQYQNQREEAKPMENKSQEKKDAEINFKERRRPSESVTLAEAKRHEIFSLSPSKISGTEPISLEDVQPNQPMVIADIIAEFMKSYGSKISFTDAYPSLLKPNELDIVSPEMPLKKPQVEKAKARKIKLKKTKEKKTKEVETKEGKTLEKIPSKRKTEPCSVCNLVRRRQSELRPYMQRMQKQRQRMELKAYYTQKILKKQVSPEARRPCAQQVLTRCYQALSICQRLLEQRRLQKSQECQP